MTQSKRMTRRDMLALGAGAAATLAIGAAPKPEEPKVTAAKLPRWRGFNLLEKFQTQWEPAKPFLESDFDMLKGWGFDFVRLPMDYRAWTKSPGEYDDKQLAEIDQGVQWGRAKGVHVNICMHRAPGYCVNPPAEKLDLWADGMEGDQARQQFAEQWQMFAGRYKGMPSSEVSFDLVNEPGDIPAEKYVRAISAAVIAIRQADPQRLVIADGLYWGNHPVPELAPLRIAQSTRGYAPMQISHYKASWMQGSDTWPAPDWPLTTSGGMDKAKLQREQIDPWKKLAAMGVGVHVGEWGAFNKTPHDIALAWMRDQLSLWKTAGWGWSLWNLRGAFGVLDSDRADVVYEDYKGRKLDKKMLDVLRQG